MQEATAMNVASGSCESASTRAVSQQIKMLNNMFLGGIESAVTA